MKNLLTLDQFKFLAVASLYLIPPLLFAETPGFPFGKPPAGMIDLKWTSPADQKISRLELPPYPEVHPDDYKPIELSYRVRLKGTITRVVVDVHATPGASLQQIRTNLLNRETASSHHDLLIFQGGKNNALFPGSNETANYVSIVTDVVNRAGQIGVPIFIQEVTPIIPEMLIQRGFNGNAYQQNIESFNAALGDLALNQGVRTVDIYDSFKPNYHTGVDAWCRNPANSGQLDGSHLSAKGAEELGRAWLEAIRSFVYPTPNPPLSVAIYGDSISATTYLPNNEKPAAWLAYYASLIIPVELSEFRIE